MDLKEHIKKFIIDLETQAHRCDEMANMITNHTGRTDTSFRGIADGYRAVVIELNEIINKYPE